MSVNPIRKVFRETYGREPSDQELSVFVRYLILIGKCPDTFRMVS